MRPNDITVILFFAHIIGILTLIHISFTQALKKQFILLADGAGFFQHKVGGEKHHGADFSAFVRTNGYATHAGDTLVAVHFSIVGGIDSSDGALAYANSTLVALSGGFRHKANFTGLPIRTVAGNSRFSNTTGRKPLANLDGKSRKLTTIVGIGTPCGIASGNGMFRHGSNSRHYTKATVHHHIAKLDQRILIGTIAIDTHQNSLCPITLQPGNAINRGRRHSSAIRRHGNHRHIVGRQCRQLKVCPIVGQIDIGNRIR